MRNLLTSLIIFLAVIVSASSSWAQPEAPGFDVQVYANVVAPATLAFDPFGVLYVGNKEDKDPDLAKIHRIGIGGSPVEEYGLETFDPEAVVFDASGAIAGVPGSVLVAGSTNGGFPPGHLSAIYPDQTTVTVFLDSSFANIQSLKFDQTDRLLLADVFTFNTLVSTGDIPQFFSSMGGFALAVDSTNRIFASTFDGDDGIIVVLAPDGTVIDPEFARLVGILKITGLAFGPPNPVWKGDLYMIAEQSIGDSRLFRIDSQGGVHEIGSNFGTFGGDLAFGPDDGLYVSDVVANAIYRVTPADVPTVSIDIKPGNKKNVINPRAKGGVWVAILSDTDTESPFDPSSQVDIPTVEFGPGGAKAVRHKVKDKNKDGLGDLLLRFKIPATGIACGDTEATLTGETFDGLSFTGTDSIKTVGCPKEKVVHIEALIDGRSQLILRGNTAQWHHLDYAAPGRHEFRNEPTIINDATWFPVWPDVPDEENRFCDCFSDVFKPVKPTLPKNDVSVDLDLIQSRGETDIVQYPSKENGYELIVEFDDNPIGGSDNYVVDVRFSKASSKPKKYHKKR